MIQVIQCGYASRHRQPINIMKKEGVPNYVLLLVRTAAFFDINNTLTDTVPNTFILYNKNAYRHYGSNTPAYDDDWIHFDLTDDDDLLTSLSIPFDTPVCLSDMPILSHYVYLLVKERHASGPNSAQIQDALMRALLYSLDGQLVRLNNTGTGQKHEQLLSDLRSNIKNSPHEKWTIDSMSKMVHMSPSYFQHLYKDLFGVSCMQDVIQARLKLSKFYLDTTDMSIQSISEICGYENELHFMRQFKKFEGMTPSQYRKLYLHRPAETNYSFSSENQ